MIFDYTLDEYELLKKIKYLFKYDESDVSDCESQTIYLNEFVSLYINFGFCGDTYGESRLVFYVIVNEQYYKVNDKMLKDIDDLGESFTKKLLADANKRLYEMFDKIKKLEIK